MYTPFRASDAILSQLNKQKEAERGALTESAIHSREAQKNDNKAMDIYAVREARLKEERAYSEFEEKVLEGFLADCIYKIYNEAVDISEDSPVATENIKKNYVYQFIQELGGARNAIRRFKIASPMLSTYALLTEKACKNNMKKVKEGEEDTFKVDTQVKSDFVEELNSKESAEVSEVIKGRVVDAVDKFVQKNATDKDDIEQITAKAQEKIDATAPEKESLQEAYKNEAAKQISDIMNRPSKSVFEAMVRSISKAAVKEEELKEVFVSEDGKIDFDIVMESAIIMYTFFEMVNTTNMVDVDQEYIKEVYESLK